MSNYTTELRKSIGHATILQVGASVIVEDNDGKVLLQLRKDTSTWGYSGGGVELDEVIEDAATRELYEETGLTAKSLELFKIFSGPETHFIYPNGDEVSNVDIIYICKDYEGTLKCQEEEVLDLKFFDIDEIPENLFPPIKKGLKAYIDYRKSK